MDTITLRTLFHFTNSLAEWKSGCSNAGGRWWIRTTEGVANRFTVCPLWPLGKSPIFSSVLSARKSPETQKNGAGGRT